MNDGLIDSFRHNAWATGQLLAVCRTLTDEQLETTVTGTYGRLRDILRHYISSEAGYCRRLTGEEPAWYQSERSADSVSIADLASYAADLAVRWDRFLRVPFDAERLFVINWHDGVDRDVPAGIILAQVLHHANEHRAQICTTLTQLGIQPPHMGLWDFAEATNRAPQRLNG
jgi:uncharacterized damage-inducible protein DinB